MTYRCPRCGTVYEENAVWWIWSDAWPFHWCGGKYHAAEVIR